jgi:hypothetical protein
MKSQSPSKLLKVLVAAGMALAGTAGARAQEKSPPPEQKADNAPPASAPADSKQNDAKTKEQEKAKADKEKQKKKEAEDQKKASQEGGGVKGW